MSFDLSAIPTKEEFMAANPEPTPVAPPSAEVQYQRKIERIQNRLTRFFYRTSNGGDHTIKVRVSDLTAEDKAVLIASVEGKGYACSEANGMMTIE